MKKELYASERMLNGAINELSKLPLEKNELLTNLYADLVTAWDRLRRLIEKENE